MTDAAVDVLVIGAGACGLAAAIAAHDAGAEVALVEKYDRLQGNTTLSSGSIPGAGTRFQRAAGVADSAARFAADLRRTAGPHEAEDVARRLAEVSGELVEWLVDRAGVPLGLIGTYRHVGHSVHRLHAPPGRRGADLLDGLWHGAQARGIPVALGNPARALLTEGAAVTGALTVNNRGEEARITARATILATNGFGANRALLAELCPETTGAAYGGAPGSEGEALVWGRALGAPLVNAGAFQGHAALADPHGRLVTWTVIEKGGFIVNAAGRRFGDESLGYSAFAALELQETGPFHAVFDGRIAALVAEGQGEFAELLADGVALEAPDAPALAARIGVPAETLAATLAEVEAARRGAPDRFGRREWGSASCAGPLQAIRVQPALFHTQGGLRVDTRARVLGTDGAPIPGLYAGGGAAAGISGSAGSAGYVSGNGLLSALGLGYIAGRHAAGQIGKHAEG